jgi:hypothetical protein
VKKIITITLLSILAVASTACGASAGSSQSNSSGGSSAANSGSSGSSNPAPINGTPATGPSALQLAAGMLKLDGTSNAVTAQQAAQLLPLWQSLQQIESTAAPQATPQSTPGAQPKTAMMQQVQAQFVLIQNAMTPSQIQAITAMNLSRQDIFTTFQQAGITMGGPGQGGGGFGPNGGTFTPPQGTPPAAGTPGAFQGNGGYGQGGNFSGRHQGFGGFIPPSVVNGIVQYLQKKLGS